jgi:hypothetical protein
MTFCKKRNIFPITFILAVVFAARLAQAACTIEEGVSLYETSLDGDLEIVEKAIDCFEELEKASPEDIRVLSYLGSSYAVKARESKGALTQLRAIRKSFKKHDYAVELAPDDFDARIFRFRVSVRVRGRVDREEELSIDSFKLAELYQGNETPERAKAMVPVYEILAEIDPDKAAGWQAQGTKAESLAAGAE